MLFTVLFTLIATATGISASVLGSSKQNSDACTRALEGIVYTPDNYDFSYLKTISEQLNVQAPLLFNTATVRSVIKSFAASYGVLVVLNDAMGGVAFKSSTNALITGNHMTSSIARAMALGEGYASASFKTTGFVPVVYTYITYSYILWNLDGQMYNVNLYLPKDPSVRANKNLVSEGGCWCKSLGGFGCFSK